VIPLLVDLETQWRGGQNQALLTLKGLRERGHAAELVTSCGSALGQRSAVCGVPVHYVSAGLAYWPAARRIRELLRSGRYELVQANEAHAVTAAWLALRQQRPRDRRPLVIARRVGYPIGKNPLARMRYESAAKIVANSRWVAECAVGSGVPREKVVVVHEGTEILPRFTAEQKQAARERWGLASGTVLLGCVGVLLPDKGQEWLVRALAQLRPEFPQTKLLLAGDGPCREKLEGLAQILQVSDAMIFAGFVRDVESVYAALDVFLLPSFFEALNNSLLAAMAYEIPSIAFDRGALGEIIEHRKSGLLVEAANPQALREAVASFLRTPPFARQLGVAGRLRVEENFSAAKMVDGMMGVYDRVLRGTGEASQPHPG